MNFLKQELIEKMKFSIFNGKSYYGYIPQFLKVVYVNTIDEKNLINSSGVL